MDRAMRTSKKHIVFSRVIGLGLILALTVTSTPALASELKQALAQHGIQAIEPQVAASDFKLPTLQGLSKFRL